MISKSAFINTIRADKDKIRVLQRTIVQQQKEIVQKDRRIEELEAQVRRMISLVETLPEAVLL